MQQMIVDVLRTSQNSDKLQIHRQEIMSESESVI